MSKKKLLALVLAGTLLMALLGACGGAASSGGTTPPASTPAAGSSAPGGDTPAFEPYKGNIVFWHSQTDISGRLLDVIVQDFNDTKGAELGITVEPVFMGQYSDATTAVNTMLQGNQIQDLPDAWMVDATGITAYVDSGHTFSVEEAIALDTAGDFDLADILAAPLAAYNIGGTQWALPMNGSTYVMYYNKTMLDAAGVTTAPDTIDGLIAAAAKLPATNEAGQPITAIAGSLNTPNLANWLSQIPGTSLNTSYVVDNRNGHDGAATKLVADEEGTLLIMLEAWKKMADAGALQSSDAMSLTDPFLAQQNAFYLASSSNYEPLTTQINNRFQLGVTYWPRLSADYNYGTPMAGSGLVAFNKDDLGKTMAAWEFMKYIESSEIQARWAAGGTGYIPTNANSVNETAYKDYLARRPGAALFLDQLAKTDPDVVNVVVGPSVDFYYKIRDLTIQMVNDNGRTPSDYVAIFAEDLNAMLDEYHRSNG